MYRVVPATCIMIVMHKEAAHRDKGTVLSPWSLAGVSKRSKGKSSAPKLVSIQS